MSDEVKMARDSLLGTGGIARGAYMLLFRMYAVGMLLLAREVGASVPQSE